MSGVLRHQFGSKSEVEFRVLRTQADTEIDGGLLGTEPSINPLNESVLQIASGSLQTQLADHWNLSLRLGESRDELETFEDGQSTGVYDSRRLQGTVQNDIRWGDNHLITAGLDYFRDKVMGTVDFQTLERDTIGFFGQWQTTHDRHQFIAGLRHDKNDTVEDSTTYNLQWAYEINQKFQLTAAYGTAFRAPGFDQLFFPGFGNPDLRPEKSDTFELGLRGNHEQGYWSFSAYNTVIDDMIAINFSLFRPENIQGVRIRGVEGEVNIISPKWRATLNGSYVDHQDDMSGKMLRRRPKGSLNLSLDRTMGRISFGTKVLWRSHSFDSDGERNRMEDYSLVDVHLAYAVSQQWMIRARINNLFDEVYETTNSFNSLDRTVFLSVTYEM